MSRRVCPRAVSQTRLRRRGRATLQGRIGAVPARFGLRVDRSAPSPPALDREAAGFEERDEAVGLVALECEGVAFYLAAAAEGGFQFVEQLFEVGRVPVG